MCMKKSILLALLCAFVFVGCESGDEYISVAWNTYERVYDQGKVWEITFTSDSLHTYWCDSLEVSAIYIQNGSIIDCISTKGNKFEIVSYKDYIQYSGEIFMKKQ